MTAARYLEFLAQRTAELLARGRPATYPVSLAASWELALDRLATRRRWSCSPGARIAQHFGRPATPNDQAWIESFFGHLKGEHPHLDKITDPGELERELDLRRVHYNTVRLHEGLGYATPDDEHHGRGPAVRPRAGLDNARSVRIAIRRDLGKDHQ